MAEPELRIQGEALTRAREALGSQFDEAYAELAIETHADVVAEARTALGANYA